jgi:hypothetical protein
MPKIEELFAFCAEESPGDEGVIGYMQNDIWTPLVGADMERVAALHGIAVAIGIQTGCTITLKRFELVNSECVYCKGKGGESNGKGCG